jgi:hypothetical protein
MDVFLIPVGPDQHEPYCELCDESAESAGPRKQGWFGTLQDRFREMLTAAERERARTVVGGEDGRGSLMSRARARVMRWIAERIAEQRLLWHLRRQERAVLIHPADVPGERALSLLLTSLERDGDRHLRWLIVDGLLLAASSVLTLIPGPNLLFWYFAFRVVGHYLSWRGANQGRRCIAWETKSNEDLASLRRVITLAPHERERHVEDIASRLQLQHLPRFFERMAVGSA